MTGTFTEQVQQSYRSIRAPNTLAQRIDEDFAQRQQGYRWGVPVFASLLVGGIALAVLGPEVSREADGVEPAPLKMSQIQVSQVTGQVGQFARLSIGQLKLPATNSRVVHVAPVAMPSGIPKLPISDEKSLVDG